MSARDPFDLVGATIAGKFRVERVLGEGGFGVVYAGTHVMLGERVAIKSVVGEVQCSLPADDTAGEAAFCGCASAAIGKWRFPPARGRLGLLDAGPFIYEYKLFPP